MNKTIKYSNIGLLFSLSLLAITACTKEQIAEPPAKVAYLNDTVLEIADGMLHFANDEDFRQTIAYNIEFNEERIFDWEKAHNFNSMWRNYIDFQEVTDQVADKNKRRQLLAERESQFRIEADGFFHPLFKSRIIGSLLNVEGKVVINGHLHCFRDDYLYIITDGSVAKLEAAFRDRKTDLDAGIIVVPQKQEISLTPRDVTSHYANCPTSYIGVVDYSHDPAYSLSSAIRTTNSCYLSGGDLRCDHYVEHYWQSRYNTSSEAIDAYMDSDGTVSPINSCTVFAGTGLSTASFSMSASVSNESYHETMQMVGYTLSSPYFPCASRLDIPTSAGSTFVDRTNDGDYGQASDDLQLKIYCQ